MSNLNDIVAQLNAAKQTLDPRAELNKEKAAQRKAKAAPKQPRAPKASTPGGSEDSRSQGKPATNAKIKLKLKGEVHAVKAVSQAAATLAASSALGAAPLDPATAPLVKRVKDVLDFVQANNGSQLTASEILEGTSLNITTDMPLLRELHRHSRIIFAGAPVPGSAAALAPSVPAAPAAWYSYLPEIQGIRDKTGLLNYIRDNKGPAVVAAPLRLAYLRAAEDLADLKAEGRIFIVGHPEPDKDTVFVRDLMGQDKIQEDVRALWFEVCQEHVKDFVPRGMQELQTAVVKAGLRSALAHQPIKRALPGGPRERAKKPRAQKFNVDKATNAHLPFLFTAAQPKNIDG